MKFTVPRGPLLEALQKGQSVVEKRNSVQILSNLLCSVKGGFLSLSATDLEVGLKVTIPVENYSEGKVAISAKHLLDIVKELPDKELHIQKKENQWIEILCGKSKFNIVSLSAEEFPSLPVFEEKNYLQARVDALKSMIDLTGFSVSTDSTRYQMTGVYFEAIDKNLMRMTATDGHRLSVAENEVFLNNPELKRGLIIPKKGLLEIRKLLEEAGSTVELAFERGYLYVKSNANHLFVRLIDGDFPDCRQVIPQSVDKIIRASKADLVASLKRVSLLAHEKSKGVKFLVQPDLLTITSSNPDIGEAREEIEVEYQGDLLEIGFNAKYLLDCLVVMNTEFLEFKLKERLTPGILQGVGQGNHMYVIMPMRI